MSSPSSIPPVGRIKRELRKLSPHHQGEVFGIPVTCWPGWDRSPYEIGTWGRRRGWSPKIAALILQAMLGGKPYGEACRTVFAELEQSGQLRQRKPRRSRRQHHTHSHHKGTRR